MAVMTGCGDVLNFGSDALILPPVLLYVKLQVDRYDGELLLWFLAAVMCSLSVFFNKPRDPRRQGGRVRCTRC